VSVKKKDTSVQCENLTGVHVRVRACCEGGAGGECVCERVCMSVRVYVCMRARVCAYIYMCTHTHTCMHVCVYVCACMCVCVACTCVCMYVYVCVCERDTASLLSCHTHEYFKGLKIVGLFCKISSLLQRSFAKETITRGYD